MLSICQNLKTIREIDEEKIQCLQEMNRRVISQDFEF